MKENSNLKRLAIRACRAYTAVRSFNKTLNNLPMRKQAAIKVPLGLALFFFSWLLTSDFSKFNDLPSPSPKPFVRTVPATAPEFVFPKLNTKRAEDER